MTESDSYAAMVRRLGWWIGAAGMVGMAAVAIQWGWREAAGFGLGAIGAYLNVRWLAKGLLNPGSLAAGSLALRFVLIGGVAYVILKTFGISPLAILAGLLTAAVAAVLEVIFQLFYART